MFQYKSVSPPLGNGAAATPMDLGAADGDENDVEISLEKLEAEAKEVRAAGGVGVGGPLTRATLSSPPQGAVPPSSPLHHANNPAHNTSSSSSSNTPPSAQSQRQQNKFGGRD